jgi:hypothetical protein
MYGVPVSGLLVLLVLVVLAIAAHHTRRRPPRRRGISLGSVSDAVHSRFLAGVLIVGLLGMPGCLGSGAPPPTTTPTAPAAARLAQVQRVLDATRRVGLVVEQVQAAEISLFRSGQVPALTTALHLTIQTSFRKTADSVIAATSALAAAVTLDPAIVVRALREGLAELSAAIGALQSAAAQQLAGWLTTAAALIEVALS